tara:strand:- start:42 stop:716 length:675 start_codon:yes stop_codon:yes gene_type:complete
MAKTFHLAIPVEDLDNVIEFYCNVLGCKKGNSEDNPPDSWCDIDFWGNELTLHASTCAQESKRHNVDMGAVLVPHFGVHLDAEEFQSLKGKLIQDWKNVEFVNDPYIRFKGNALEQETMFIKDPSGNVIELKTMVNPDALFQEDHEAPMGDLRNLLEAKGISTAHQELRQNFKKMESAEKLYRTGTGKWADYGELKDKLNKREQTVIRSTEQFLRCLDDAKIEF